MAVAKQAVARAVRRLALPVRALQVQVPPERESPTAPQALYSDLDPQAKYLWVTPAMVPWEASYHSRCLQAEAYSFRASTWPSMPA